VLHYAYNSYLVCISSYVYYDFFIFTFLFVRPMARVHQMCCKIQLVQSVLMILVILQVPSRAVALFSNSQAVLDRSVEKERSSLNCI